MEINIRLIYDTEQTAGPHTVEVTATIDRPDPTEEIEGATSFVGDVLHYARPTVRLEAAAPLTAHYQQSASPADAEPDPELRCQRLGCGHGQGYHTDLDGGGNDVGPSKGACSVCAGSSDGVPPPCWSFFSTAQMPRLSAVQP